MEREHDVGREEVWPYLKKASAADVPKVIR